MPNDEATAAFLASIDVVSLEFRRLVVELQQAKAGESATREDLRLLVAPMTLALRDMAAHAEADENAEGADTSSGSQPSEAHRSKRRRVGAPVDVVGAGLGFFAHQRSVLFPAHREHSEDPPDTTEQLKLVLQQLERHQSRVFADKSPPPLTFERPRRAGGTLGVQLHAECSGICTWTITLSQRGPEDGVGGVLHIDDICAAGLDEIRSCKQWFDDPARRAWHRSRHAVFASLSDAAMDAATHYAAVFSAEPGRGVLQTLIWLVHARTLFEEPCMVCGRVLSWGEPAVAPTPPTGRHFETFRALHSHCR